jgi:DNA-binding XRE family transcriptional regulator
MTNAEFKTLREACGLSQRVAAQLLGNNERTVRYWEDGTSAVPNDAAELVTTIDATLSNAAREALQLAQSLRAKHDAPEAITLFRYSSDAELWAARVDMQGLPTTCHAALLYRARALLIDDGFTVEIHWA